jgi:hypothetical protein
MSAGKDRSVSSRAVSETILARVSSGFQNDKCAHVTVNYLSDDILERSAVVANCRMNRERNLLGSNGYEKELGFNPLDFCGRGLPRDNMT